MIVYIKTLTPALSLGKLRTKLSPDILALGVLHPKQLVRRVEISYEYDHNTFAY